jgi:Fe-S cluster assembly ATPase SufC
MSHQFKTSTLDSDGRRLFSRTTFSFRKGVTIIVGCNGSGKTTLMRRIEERYRCEGTVSAKLFRCCDTADEIDRLMQFVATEDAVNMSVTMLFSSEGERMAMALKKAFDWMWNECRREGVEEIFMMLDSLDSGVDVPTLRMILGVLDDAVGIAERDFGKTLYVLVSANGYALVENRDCLDVSTAKRVTFDGWDDYARFCVRSDKKKQRRYDRG